MILHFFFKSGDDPFLKSINDGRGKLWAALADFYQHKLHVIRWFTVCDLGGGTFDNKEQTGYIDFGHDAHMTMTIPIFLSEASAGTGGGGASGKINQEMLFCLTSPPPPTNVWAPQETFRKREHNVTQVLF